MALTKITSSIIADGAITTAAITDTSITAAKLHATLDLTGKTVTVATATAGDNDTTVASTAFVSTAISNLADSAPSTLNTLNELAAALGDDANFSTTVTNSIATKLPLSGGTMTGAIAATDFEVDASGDINLDAGGGDWRLKDDGTTIATISNVSGDLQILLGQDKDYKFNIDDNGSQSTALLLDGSAAGAATFNSSVNATNLLISGAQGSDGQVLTSTGSGVAWEDAAGGVAGITSSADATAITIDSSERVMIGSLTSAVSANAQKLQIANAGATSVYQSSLVLQSQQNDGNANVTRIGFYGGDGSSAARGFSSIEGGKENSTSGEYGGMISMSTRPHGGTSTERMRIDSAGNMLLGTTSHSTGAFGAATGINIKKPRPQVLLQDTTNNTDGYLGLTTAGLFLATQDALSISFHTSDVERAVITSAGNVGIGTTAPSTELHVYSADQNALKVQTNTGINQIEMANSTNSPTYITANSYALQLKADDNGWGGTNSGIQFRVKNAETFRCDYAGSTFFNTTSGYGTPKYSVMWVKMSSGSQRGISFKATSTSSTDDALLFFNGGAGACGSVTMTYSATSYNTSSDYRLKENVVYDWDATTRLKQLKPCRFNWISDDTNTAIDGFLAHEAAAVVPNAVTGEKDATKEAFLDDDGNEMPGTTIKEQVMDHAKLVPLLVKTIQELEARITTLEG